MAGEQTQVSSDGGSTWADVAWPAAKDGDVVKDLAPYQQQQVMEAANEYTLVSGAAGSVHTRVDKMADAVGCALQWA